MYSMFIVDGETIIVVTDVCFFFTELRFDWYSIWYRFIIIENWSSMYFSCLQTIIKMMQVSHV